MLDDDDELLDVYRDSPQKAWLEAIGVAILLLLVGGGVACLALLFL